MKAPKNHPHKWDYFRRLGRGVYEICRAYRRVAEPKKARTGEKTGKGRPSEAVGEPGVAYQGDSLPARRGTVHAVVTRDGEYYVGECLELAVVTQGRTLDEIVFNLREAIGLHLEGEDPGRFGLVAEPRLTVMYEVAAHLD